MIEKHTINFKKQYALIGGWLLYNVVLVSAIQKSKSVIRIYIYIYTHTHTHTYIYMNTHTHTHTHICCLLLSLPGVLETKLSLKVKIARIVVNYSKI